MKNIIFVVMFNLSVLWRIKTEELKTQDTIQENPTNFIQKTTNPQEQNLFQKIRVPVGGPYCYPEILNENVYDDVILRRTTRLAYSPQQRVESHELMEPSYPKGIIENVWPYEKNQSQKKREIRQYVRLNISPDSQDNADYRLIGKAAERAFISRFYGFINTTESKTVDDLIRFIEDTEKVETHFALETDFDPLIDFNSWDQSERLKFCEKYIDYSIVLFQLNIDFDPSRPNEIIREQKYVRYKNPHLASIIDTVHVVKCPCTDISTNTTLELGVLPVTYKYKQNFEYAFIYNYLENDPRRSDQSDIGEVKVRALTKIDIKGIKEQRKENEERNRAESGILHKIFAPFENLHHHQDSHSSERNTSQEKDDTEEKDDENEEGADHNKISHNRFTSLGNFFHHHQDSNSKKENINKQQEIAEEKKDKKQQKQMYKFLNLEMENSDRHQNSNSKKGNSNKLKKITEGNDEKEHKQRYNYLNLRIDEFNGNN